TDGFNIATGTGDRDGEQDGDRNITLTGRANWDATDDLSFGGSLFFVDRESDFDDQAFPFAFDPGLGFFVPDLGDPTFNQVVDSDDINDATDLSIGIFGRYEMLDDALVHQVNFDFTHNTSDSISDGLLSFGSKSRRLKAGYQASYAFATGDVEHSITGLTEFEEERNQSNTAARQTRTLFGIGGEYRIAYGPAALQGSLRNDFNDEFEDALTFAVSGSYLVEASGTRFHGSVGRGVTNPSFFEQFGFNPTSFIGNPDLIPERTFQWDVGVEQTLLGGDLIVDATYFQGKVTDEIVGGFNTVVNLPTSENADGESPRQGVEVALTAFPIENLAITGSYTYTLAEEGSTNRQEVRRARHLASLDATYTFLDGRATLNGNVAYNGDQRDNDFSTGFVTPQPLVTLDSFVLLSLQGSYSITPDVDLYARLENATNADYQEVFNYESQGISGFAGVKVRF
ncbi:MAG: TonB-dependent receptor, partial [Pseudomonadota bacterium]